jgi:hypothetical protein
MKTDARASNKMGESKEELITRLLAKADPGFKPCCGFAPPGWMANKR